MLELKIYSDYGSDFLNMINKIEIDRRKKKKNEINVWKFKIKK